MKKHRYIGLITTYHETTQGWLAQHLCEEKHQKRITTWCVPQIIATLTTSADIRFYWPYNDSDVPSKIKTRLTEMVEQIHKQVEIEFHTQPSAGEDVRVNDPPTFQKRNVYFVHTKAARLFTLYAEW